MVLETVSKTEAFDLLSKLRSREASAINAEYIGYTIFPSKTNANQMCIKELVQERRHVTIHDVADEMRILFGPC
jgi:hypothetical protein